MKRVLCALLVAVLLLATAWDGVVARTNPLGYKPVDRDNGEDHPWGGEERLDPDPTPIRSAVNPGYTLTGFVQFDNFLWRLVTTYWIDHITVVEPTTVTEGSTNYHTTPGEVTTGTTSGSGSQSAH